MAGVLEEALAAWERLPAEDRRLAPDVAERIAVQPFGGVDRFESSYPEDGLVLHATFRDLPEGASDALSGPADPGEPDATGRGAWNLDFAWFRASELDDLVPPDLAVGADHEVPTAPVLERLARFHLVDSVRGQTWAFDADDIESARLTVRVLAYEGDELELQLEGSTRCVSNRPWRTWGKGQQREDPDHARGVQTRLLGRATFDTDRRRFTRFDLVAVGERWGGSDFNGRRRQPEPSPFAVSFRLAREVAAERIAPAFLSLYGWPDVSGGGCAPLEPGETR